MQMTGTLIADSGSTKTDWCLVADNGTRQAVTTKGINPIHQSEQVITEVIRLQLLPFLPSDVDVRHVYFYGSGCITGQCEKLENIFKEVLKSSAEIACYSDMLGAARALFGHQAGIACILGTGANSCLYDGEQIRQNTPPLGYILGDEGSGAYLGKNFLRELLRGQLGDKLLSDFYSWANTDYVTVIQRIYHEPMANRYLASICPFIERHLNNLKVHNLCMQAFKAFADHQLEPYHRHDLPVSFVGGVASSFQNMLSEVMADKGYVFGNVIKRPLEALVDYHTKL